jgi:glycosyltransferase involved in cell wall biosynthesis
MRRAAPGVYDLDDGLPWDDGKLPGLGRWWKRPFPRSRVAHRAASAADRVIAGNDILGEWASSLCSDVVIVPTCVEPKEYSIRSAWDIDEHEPVLGWIGAPATEPYLDEIADALVEVNRRSGARLEIVSGNGSTSAALAPFASRRRWAPGATTWISKWDIGLMPLRDGVYERAKCGYKLLQYAASGVPAIGSPVGVNARLLADMDGLAPISHGDWVEALVGMLAEPAERRRRRAMCGLGVAQRYSYDEWQQRWLAAVGW